MPQTCLQKEENEENLKVQCRQRLQDVSGILLASPEKSKENSLRSTKHSLAGFETVKSCKIGLTCFATPFNSF
jgi:hypothetical protein